MTAALANQSLQATVAAPGELMFDFSHGAIVAGASALPASAPELSLVSIAHTCP